MGLLSEQDRARIRRSWAALIVVVVITAAIGGAAVFLLPLDLLGDAVAAPDWLSTTGVIVEAVGVLGGIFVWVRAVRAGEKPFSQSLVLAPLSRPQRRRIANQIKNREPVLPEERVVVVAAARQSLVVQRFSLRMLPAWALFGLGNLLWTYWIPAKVLFFVALVMLVVVAPIAFKSLRRTESFLENARS